MGNESNIDPFTVVGGTETTTGTYELSLDGGGTTVDLTAATADGTITAAEVADAINNEDGFDAEVNDAGQIVVSKADGTDFTLTETVTSDGATEIAGGFDATSAGTDYSGDKISITSTTSVALAGDAVATLGLDSVGNATTTINNVDISTREGATTAISSVDAALSQIDTIRGDLGAVQNRFESTIANLQNVSENLSAARSRILDADIAAETSNMTKQNILQQAGVSILAQANQAPQLALSLLG
ncbi:flagellin [Desulfuromonas acetoxidans]|uniref:flagellin n=1 Tax=Desulfuromonas acetoxidans TaxID=891 RepID=UPI0037494674